MLLQKLQFLLEMGEPVIRVLSVQSFIIFFVLRAIDRCFFKTASSPFCLKKGDDNIV